MSFDKGDGKMDIIRMSENSWRIEDGEVRFFLLAGNKKALLIDSGMNVHNAKEIAQQLVSLPVELLNTHGDMKLSLNTKHENHAILNGIPTVKNAIINIQHGDTARRMPWYMNNFQFPVTQIKDLSILHRYETPCFSLYTIII